MPNTTFDDHDDRAYDVQRVLEKVVDELSRRQCTSHFERIFDGKHLLHGKTLVQEPERFTEDYLIFPILRSLGHSIRPQPKQYAPRWPRRSGTPDFALETIPILEAKEQNLRLFGEAKAPNKLDYARKQVKGYLDSDLDFGAVVIISDGLEWELWYRHRGMSKEQCGGQMSVKTALERTMRRNKAGQEYQAHHARSALHEASLASFSAAGICDLLADEFGHDDSTIQD